MVEKNFVIIDDAEDKENKGMGFFDKDVKNGFDKMFDLNKDGVLDPGEQAMQFAFVDKISREEYSDEEEDELDRDELFDEDEEDED